MVSLTPIIAPTTVFAPAPILSPAIMPIIAPVIAPVIAPEIASQPPAPQPPAPQQPPTPLPPATVITDPSKGVSINESCNTNMITRIYGVGINLIARKPPNTFNACKLTVPPGYKCMFSGTGVLFNPGTYDDRYRLDKIQYSGVIEVRKTNEPFIADNNVIIWADVNNDDTQRLIGVGEYKYTYSIAAIYVPQFYSCVFFNHLDQHLTTITGINVWTNLFGGAQTLNRINEYAKRMKVVYTAPTPPPVTPPAPCKVDELGMCFYNDSNGVGRVFYNADFMEKREASIRQGVSNGWTLPLIKL